MKVFISHSSVQKDFAKLIVDKLGKDQCVLDAYDFEPAYTSISQIIDGINRSDVFVFLVTRESLASDWCEKEVVMAEEALRERRLKIFLPYIIDPELGIEDVPEWMSKTKCFNLKYFRSPILLARDIDKKLTELEWDAMPLLRRENEIFVGRNSEINEFQTKKARKRHATCLVVSGRVGAGRHHFADRCVREIDRKTIHLTERISLSNEEGLEDFIIQMNSTTFLCSDEYLAEVLKAEEDRKIATAVDLINEIYRYHGRIEITDHRMIVNNQGRVNDWFRKIIESPALDKRMGVVVVSSMNPRADEECNIDPLVTVCLGDLSDDDRRVIFTSYLDEYGVSDISDEDVSYFVNLLLQSPSQLRQIAGIIKNRGVREAKQCAAAIRDKGDSLVSELIADFAHDEEVIQFLLLLSEMEIAAYEDLKAIYNDDFALLEKTIIPDLLNRSIIFEFGPSATLIRADAAVSDYLQRGKKRLNMRLRNCLDGYVRGIVNENVKLTDAPTRYMLQCRDMLAHGNFKLEKLLLPSIALKSIIKLYNRGNDAGYEATAKLCKEVLAKAHQINLMEAVRQDVCYYLCLSLAHLNDEKGFFSNVKEFKGVMRDFLLAFWFRQIHNYPRAKEYLERVLMVSKMRKARNEYVIVLTMMRRYDEAREYASEQYENDRDNPYYITSYFKCLVLGRERGKDDAAIMEELIDRMGKSIVKDRDQYVDAMKLLRFVKDLLVPRSEKYNRVEELRRRYSDMNSYLKDALDFSQAYLSK